MANTLGTLTASEIVSEALALIFQIRPALRAVTLDLSSDTADYNSSIVTRTLAIPAVNDFGTGAVDTADTDVSVTLNKFKEVHYTFTAVQLSGTKRNLLQERAMPFAEAIADHMMGAIAALWTIGNYDAAAIVKAAGHDYEMLVDIRKALNTGQVPEANRFLVCNPTVYANLLKDTMIVTALNNPNNSGAIASGRLPQVAGLGLAEYGDMPSTGNMLAFAGTPDSVVLATRIPKDPRTISGATYPGTLVPITNAETGLTVLLNEYIDQATLAASVRVIWMYGVSVGNGNNGQLVTSV